MNEKVLDVILSALRHARDTVEALACENYPYTAFYDERLKEIFYDLNDMNIKVTKIIDEQKKEA